jgi:hypothetical protein
LKKNIMKCPHCGDSHPDEANYCPNTGRTIDRIRRCNHCGEELSDEVEFCPACGTQVDGYQFHEPFDPWRFFQQYRIPGLLLLGILVVVFLISNRPVSPPNDPAPPKRQEQPTESIAPAVDPDDAPTPTRRPTRTPTKTPDPGPWVACKGTYLSRLHVGDDAFVAPQPPLANRVRSDPNLGGNIIGHIQPGESMKILKGPECANDWVWWYVIADKGGLKGWTSEGDEDGYWLTPKD